MHVLIEELAIRRMKHQAGDKLQRIPASGGGTEVALLIWLFSFVLQQALSFRTRYHLCRQEGTLTSGQLLSRQGPMPIPAHCTEERTKSEGREGATGDGNEVEDGREDGNGTRTRVAAEMETETGAGTETRVDTGVGTRKGTRR